MNKIYKSILQVGVDFLILSSLMIGLFSIAYDNFDLTNNTKVIYTLLFYAAVVNFKLIFYGLSRVYQMITVYFGIVDAVRLGIITASATIISFFAMALLNEFVFFWSLQEVAILIMSESFLMIMARLFKRILGLYLVRNERLKSSKRTLIIGAGAAGKIIVDEFRTNLNLKNYVVAFVDDDASKYGNTFSGVNVYGPISNISALINEFKVTEVVIAISNLSRERLFDIIRLMEKDDVSIKRLPLMEDLKGKSFKAQIQQVDIHELLGRDIVPLENKDIQEFIQQETILITGAGGSIGSELVRQIMRYHPKKVIVFDIYENTLFELLQELHALKRKTSYSTIEVVGIIGSTYDRSRLDQVFGSHQPTLVFHAAAYKHVPLMEDSPMEAVRTNMIGTYYVCELASLHKVKKVVFVSTDKAVRPTNVMGASKAFAELIMKKIARQPLNQTVFSAVRFGNVLGSNGSVIPLFQKQIENGGPITITHKDITRYFMTIPEAVGLILQSGAFAKGEEIFILDMGRPVRIYDLALKMIRQAGFIPQKEILIEEIGLRPGEKLFEELLVNPEQALKTLNSKIFVDTQNTIEFYDFSLEDMVNLTKKNSTEIKQFFINKGILVNPKESRSMHVQR
jgi:FlaA1/EpsC-like NDP-sugar epimerase